MPHSHMARWGLELGCQTSTFFFCSQLEKVVSFSEVQEMRDWLEQ